MAYTLKLSLDRRRPEYHAFRDGSGRFLDLDTALGELLRGEASQAVQVTLYDGSALAEQAVEVGIRLGIKDPAALSGDWLATAYAAWANPCTLTLDLDTAELTAWMDADSKIARLEVAEIDAEDDTGVEVDTYAIGALTINQDLGRNTEGQPTSANPGAIGEGWFHTGVAWARKTLLSALQTYITGGATGKILGYDGWVTAAGTGDVVGPASATDGGLVVLDGTTGKRIKQFAGLVAGDVLYCAADGIISRLAKGTDGQILKLASGVPTWAAESGGGGASLTPIKSGNTGGSVSSYQITTFGLTNSTRRRLKLRIKSAASAGYAMSLLLDNGAGTVDTTKADYYSQMHYFSTATLTNQNNSDNRVCHTPNAQWVCLEICFWWDADDKVAMVCRWDGPDFSGWGSCKRVIAQSANQMDTVQLQVYDAAANFEAEYELFDY